MPQGYGITTDPATAPSWEAIVDKIARSRNYWIGSTRPDGRPHVMPVWGVWVDGALHFSTDPASRKGRNLSRQPEVVVNLESGDDVVILEGTVEKITDRAALTRFADAYDAKYEFRPDPDDPGSFAYAVRPRVAHTWLEKDFPKTALRWRFS
jgi:PPOX class probable F420-dependent enzyme